MRGWIGMAVLAGLLAPRMGEAAVVDFVAGCMGDGGDLHTLPERLARAGLVEVDPARGPQGPAFAQAAGRRRLWALAGTGPGDSYTGYGAAEAGRPFETCWHVSRPGDSAADAMTALWRLYPPLRAAVEAGAEAFYGGFERWPALVGRMEVVMGVTWPFRERPEEGTGYLYLVRPVPGSGKVDLGGGRSE